ncbi:inactive pancreatic lipase-related protein 1-like isoform 2-T2 [Discoglossus pictus]
MLAVWTVTLSLLSAVDADPPFGGTAERPLQFIPPSPILQLKLFTSKNTHDFQEITCSNGSTMTSSNFDCTRNITFVIHGYLESTKEPWMKEMCQALIKQDNVNCILVDWSSMSSTPYAQAANIVRVVGAKLAVITKCLMKQYPSISASNIHIIGHSLGAQIAGHVGKRITLIWRLTGLDPAGPYFHNTPDDVRLSKNDAVFVDIIHSNAKRLAELGVGIIHNCGDMDFYPNGGKEMTECTLNRLLIPPPVIAFCLLGPIMGPLDCSEIEVQQRQRCLKILSTINIPYTIFKGLVNLLFCDHMQSTRYYIHSISHPEEFKSCPCESLEKCQAGECNECPSEGSPHMGHHARPGSHETTNQIYCLRTAMPTIQIAQDIMNAIQKLSLNELTLPVKSILNSK